MQFGLVLVLLKREVIVLTIVIIWWKYTKEAIYFPFNRIAVLIVSLLMRAKNLLFLNSAAV